VQGKLRQGTSYSVISNTASTPIGGTFANLPDGAILSVSGNNLQASYSGGDGNDLTLSVVP
jgi:fibronectin-binding autotransporter adhesin